MTKGTTLIPHLHCHSEYSLSHGMVRLSGPDELGKLAAQRGIGAVALTDSNNIHAAIRHHASCLRHGVKPILGCQAAFTRAQLEFSAILLCEDADGFFSLSSLLTRAQIDNQGRIDTDNLQQGDVKGLIMLSGHAGDVGAALRTGKEQDADRFLNSWRELFGDRLACEITFAGRADEDALSHHLALRAGRAGVAVAAAHPILFASEDDFEHHEVRTCIANAWQHGSSKRPRNFTAAQYFKSADEMRQLFSKWPGALENAAEIARRCNYDFGLNAKPQFPLFHERDKDMPTLLREQAAAGLERVLPPGANRERYERRLREELEVIISKGFADYFLIVAEFVRYGHENGIAIGPGRGSGSGSLVAYCLGITNIDPIVYGLLFERFLNPERTAMPDFDIDFCKRRRSEIFAHAREKYGEDCVSQVVTFGSLKAKAVVRDVSRVLGLPYAVGDRFARLIPDELNIRLEEARAKTKELDNYIKSESSHQRVWQHGLALEGLPRQASTHAAAILIAPRQLTHYCPLALVGDRSGKVPVSQYDKDAAEAIGLIKFDFLGLKNLTMLQEAEKEVRKKDPDFKLESIDLNDNASFSLYRKGETIGVFQCESEGMVALMKQLQPRKLEDIALMISMYRPGVLSNNMHTTYLSNRNNPDGVRYPNDKMKEVLAPTFGVMIYQEQVMRLSQELAGFSLGKADVLRAAIGKKDAKAMELLGDDFISASSKSLGADGAKRLFDDIKEFAGYGFNKSHAVAYAMLSLQTAYLKANHKEAFYAASLTTWADDTKTQAQLLEDARRNKVEISLPCINSSNEEFTVASKGKVRFGLGSIRGVGTRFARHLVEQREKNGPFTSIEDLSVRAPRELLSRRLLQNLIKSGACDCLKPNGKDYRAWRVALLGQVNAAIEYASFTSTHANQNDLFGGDGDNGLPAPAPVNEVHANELLTKKFLLAEEEALGKALTKTFYSLYSWMLPTKVASLSEESKRKALGSGRKLWAGHVTKYITNARIREQRREVFILNDDNGHVEVNVSHAGNERTEVNHVDLANKGEVVVIDGTMEQSRGGTSFVLQAHKVRSIDSWCLEEISKVVLNDDDYDWAISMLQGKAAAVGQQVRLMIHTEQSSGELDLNAKFKLSADDLVLINERLGPNNLSVIGSTPEQ